MKTRSFSMLPALAHYVLHFRKSPQCTPKEVPLFGFAVREIRALRSSIVFGKEQQLHRPTSAYFLRFGCKGRVSHLRRVEQRICIIQNNLITRCLLSAMDLFAGVSLSGGQCLHTNGRMFSNLQVGKSGTGPSQPRPRCPTSISVRDF